jgi:hypothetical protein
MSEARARDWVGSMQEKEDEFGLLLKAKREKSGLATGPTETVEAWATRWLADRKARGLESVDSDERVRVVDPEIPRCPRRCSPTTVAPSIAISESNRMDTYARSSKRSDERTRVAASTASSPPCRRRAR